MILLIIAKRTWIPEKKKNDPKKNIPLKGIFYEFLKNQLWKNVVINN